VDLRIDLEVAGELRLRTEGGASVAGGGVRTACLDTDCLVLPTFGVLPG